MLLSLKETCKRHSMAFFGIAVLCLALGALAFPFSANAIRREQAAKELLKRQELPTAPHGNRLGLPYETRPEPQSLSPSRNGGPDGYGYIFEDETEPGGPVYAWRPAATRIPDNWERTSGGGANRNDDGVVTTTLPFTFTLYGVEYRTMHIGTNGNVHFGNPNDWFPSIQSQNCVPNAIDRVPKAMLAPIWADLVVPTGTGDLRGVFTNVEGTAPNRIFTVEWRRVYDFNASGSSLTFELLLYENGESYFQYQELSGTNVGGRNGAVGIQNITGTIGLPYLCYEERLIPTRAVRYKVRQAAIFSFPTAAQEGARGGLITYTGRLLNQTGIDNRFTIQVRQATTNSWETTITPTRSITLSNGVGIDVQTVVSVPTNIALWRTDVATITVTSDLPTLGAYTATAILTSTVGSNGVDFSPRNQSKAGDYGSTVTYTSRLTNSSSVANTFVITASETQWETGLEPSEPFTLTPGMTATMNVSVLVPAGSSLGANDVVTIRASSLKPIGNPYYGETVFTTTAGVWRPRTNMPVSRSRGAGVLFPANGRIYAVAGESFGGNLNLPIEEFDAPANTWTDRTQLQVGVSNAGAAAIRNAIYVPGGYNPGLGGAQTRLQVFYPLENRVETIETDPLPAPRMGAGVAALGGRLYVIGGSDNSLIGANTVYEYNPAAAPGSRWRLRSPMNYSRVYLGAASLNGLIYAAGGMPGPTTDLNVVESYNPQTDSWTVRAPMSRGRAGLALVGVGTGAPGCGGYLYAIGGGWQAYTAGAERYNPSTDAWEPVSSILVARRTLAAAYSSRTYSLLAFGGWGGQYEIATEEVRCNGSAQPSTPTPTATTCPIAFSDVSPSDYFYQAVRYLFCAGVVSGYSDGTFRPYSNTTRGQLCKIVALAEGWTLLNPKTPAFIDVPRESAFYVYIETAYAQEVVSGYSCGTNCLEFRPNNNITRGQLCKIVVLAEGWTITTKGGPHFADVPAEYVFYPYVETAYYREIISGYGDGTFRPGNPATRGHICKIVYLAVTAP